MRTNNFFSLHAMLKLHRQLHSSGNVELFKTVGEVIKWRDVLDSRDRQDASYTWNSIQAREKWLSEQMIEGVLPATRSVTIVVSQVKDLKDAQAFRQAQRAADIRAINQFLERCGLSL